MRWHYSILLLQQHFLLHFIKLRVPQVPLLEKWPWTLCPVLVHSNPCLGSHWSACVGLMMICVPNDYRIGIVKKCKLIFFLFGWFAHSFQLLWLLMVFMKTKFKRLSWLWKRLYCFIGQDLFRFMVALLGQWQIWSKCQVTPQSVDLMMRYRILRPVSRLLYCCKSDFLWLKIVLIIFYGNLFLITDTLCDFKIGNRRCLPFEVVSELFLPFLMKKSRLILLSGTFLSWWTVSEYFHHA